MSAYIYATAFKCDWPDCQSTADVPSPMTSTGIIEHPPPAGWAHFRPGDLRTWTGMHISDLCSIHSRKTAADLADMLNDRVPA